MRPGLFYAWDDVYGGALWPHTAAGVTIDVWIVDVHGTRLFIEAETSRQADPDLEQEVQQIVGSIRFPSKPTVDHVLDLNTGVMTPLPEPIVGAEDEPSQYAVSPEGSRLAYVAPDDDGTSQIFVADLDGSRVRQMTDDPIGADWPTWSPNGATIAYEGYGAGYGIGDVRNLARLEAGLPLRVRARVEAFEAARAKAVHRSKPAERVMKMLDAMRAESVA